MIFTQLAFLAFFVVTAGVHWILRGNRARKLGLLAASYFVYGYWDYRFLALIFSATLLDYGTAIALGRSHAPRLRRLLITISVCANLGLLGFSKYYNYFVESGAELPSSALVLPSTAFSEKDGTMVNDDGRVQRLRPATELPRGIRSAHDVFQEVLSALDAWDRQVSAGGVFRELAPELGLDGATHGDVGNQGILVDKRVKR